MAFIHWASPVVFRHYLYNGIYRALQHDYKPTDDVQWLIDNPNVEAYVLNTLDYFRHNPALFLRSTDQTLGTLEKLQKYLGTVNKLNVRTSYNIFY